MTSQQRPSAVLILALLLMGAVIASTIALSTVISDSTRQSQTLNDFIAASLAADSGLERGLSIVHAARPKNTITEALIVMGPKSPLLHVTGSDLDPISIDANNKVMINGSNSSSETDQFTWPRLLPRESTNVDILSYDNDGRLQATNTDRIHVQGNLAQPISGHDGQGALDVSWVGLNGNGEPIYSGRRFLTKTEVHDGTDCLLLNNIRDLNGNVPDINSTRGFRVKITAVDQPDIPSLSPTENTTIDTVTNIKVSGITEGFPSRINITSTGKKGVTQSQKMASVLWQLPVSPVFGFVLFTEGDIIPD